MATYEQAVQTAYAQIARENELSELYDKVIDMIEDSGNFTLDEVNSIVRSFAVSRASNAETTRELQDRAESKFDYKESVEYTK